MFEQTWNKCEKFKEGFHERYLFLDNCNYEASLIERWLKTYLLPPFDGSGGVGGPVATLWASSPYYVGPYVMNVYGSLMGLIKRKNDKNFKEIYPMLEKFGEFYIRIQEPTTGIFISNWGEDPFIPAGLVQQSSVVVALYNLYMTNNLPEFIKSADLGLKACLENPFFKSLRNVINQALRFCEALLLNQEIYDHSKYKSLLREIIQQIKKLQFTEPDLLKGALPQSLFNPQIILVYQGKCLYPLVKIWATYRMEDAIDIAVKLGNFILNTLEMIYKKTGYYLVGGIYIPQRRFSKLIDYFSKIRKVFPFLSISLNRLKVLSIKDWIFNIYPIWIARSADTARGVYWLGKVTGEKKYIDSAFKILNDILKFKSPLGGIRNTIGFYGFLPSQKNPFVWQDLLPIPRWNNYVLQFLNELSVGKPIVILEDLSENINDEFYTINNEKIVEDKFSVKCVNNNQRLNWIIKKAKRWGLPFRHVEDWDELGAAKILKLV
ncbi:MAG: hypothetical protein NC926_06785 [Candidatus Omnitrophica bacterium]|nr:hypothetical protein [Candidatus Omnitrophota bacterium]